jgi:hypothetical protein
LRCMTLNARPPTSPIRITGQPHDFSALVARVHVTAEQSDITFALLLCGQISVTKSSVSSISLSVRSRSAVGTVQITTPHSPHIMSASSPRLKPSRQPQQSSAPKEECGMVVRRVFSMRCRVGGKSALATRTTKCPHSAQTISGAIVAADDVQIAVAVWRSPRCVGYLSLRFARLGDEFSVVSLPCQPKGCVWSVSRSIPIRIQKPRCRSIGLLSKRPRQNSYL